MKYDICVIGLGYIGLPTASIFASRGKKVLGVDIVKDVVDQIRCGKIHIEEPDLDVLVTAGIASGQLVVSTKAEKADVFIIAVPTPFIQLKDRISPDLSHVESAARSLALHLEEGNLVVLESTSPVGTTEKVRDWIFDELIENGSTVDPSELLFAHCPERILPGQMLKELVFNDRLVGGLSTEAADKAKELYRCFCKAEILISDARTAELVKLAENAFRDVNIAFANELSIVCDKLGISVWETVRLANHHPRVNILNPGPGVGGHCIAVDPYFIVDAVPDSTPLIRAARIVNESKPEFIIQKVLEAVEAVETPVICCMGLAFKADVDDLRESPAKKIVEKLLSVLSSNILVVEPFINVLPEELSRAKLVDCIDGIRNSNIIVLLVDHSCFKSIDPDILKGKCLIDSRGVFQLD